MTTDEFESEKQYFMIFSVNHPPDPPGGIHKKEDMPELDEMIVFLHPNQEISEKALDAMVAKDVEEGKMAGYLMMLVCSCCGGKSSPYALVYDASRKTMFMAGPGGMKEIPPRGARGPKKEEPPDEKGRQQEGGYL